MKNPNNFKPERATESDYEEIIKFSDTVFFSKIKIFANFKKDMSKVYVNRPKMANFHWIIKEEGKIIASALFYPSILNVGDESLTTVAVGTVAADKNYRNRGLMTTLFAAAEEELSKADLCILAGNRKRYENFGFYLTGIIKNFTIMKHNFKNEQGEVALVPLKKAPQFAKEIAKLNNKNNLFVERKPEDIEDILRTYNAKGYVILKNGEFSGYLSYNWREFYVCEINTDCVGLALKALMKKFHLPYKFSCKMAIDGSKENVWLNQNAEKFQLMPSYNYRINNFTAVIRAFLKQKATVCNLDDGELFLQIEDESIKIEIKNNQVLVTNQQNEEAIYMDKRSAHLKLFGMDGFLEPVFKNWFPLYLAFPSCDNV